MTAIALEPATSLEVVPSEMSDLDTASAVLQVADLIPYASQEARLALAALLEMRGITDDVACNRGATNIFDLANQLLATDPTDRKAPAQPLAPPDGGWWRHLLIGPVQGMVMLFTLALLALAESGLQAAGVWAATTMLATVMSTIVVGGALQLSAWLVSIAMGRNQMRALRAALWHGARVGMGAVLALTLALACAGLLLGVELRQILAVAAICTLATPLLLATGLLLLLKRRVTVMLILAVIVGVIAAMFTFTTGVAYHLIIIGVGTLGATAALGVMIEHGIRQLGRTMNSDRLDLPFAGLIIHETSPLICYGALSVILVFAGQLPGWLAIGPQSAQVALMLAHIVGLGVFVLGQGAFEAAMHNLWGTSVAIRHKLALAEADAVGARFGAFIRSAMGRALLVQLAITAMVGGGAALLLRVAPAAELVLSIGPTLVVCLLGYSILGHALFLCGVLNTLGARWAVVRIISAAIVTTGFYATLAANWWGPLSTPLGLLGGALLLLGLAFGELRGLLREGDCTLYRAF